MREQTSDIFLLGKRHHIKISVATGFCPQNLWNSENMSDDFYISFYFYLENSCNGKLD
jgi:tellurite resistance-related uncharacterized protein